MLKVLKLSVYPQKWSLLPNYVIAVKIKKENSEFTEKAGKKMILEFRIKITWEKYKKLKIKFSNFLGKSNIKITWSLKIDLPSPVHYFDR